VPERVLTPMFSFLGRGQEHPALQLYGKLPLAKDYLRVGCGDGAGRDLREWLDRTFGTGREELVLHEPLRFLGQGAKDPLQGILWPSSDVGGLRKFPFTLFVERRRKAVLADLARGLTEAEGVWRLLAEERERCLAFEDGRELLDDHRGRELEIGADLVVADEHADLDAWVEALWGRDAGLDGLRAACTRIAALVRERYAGPYRLPLVRELPLRDQVLAWVHVLRTLGGLADDELPTLFFPPRSLAAPGGVGSLVVSPVPLGDERVGWLTAAPGDPACGAGDLAAECAEPAGDASVEGARPLRDSLREVLASLPAT
jgi:hypothetical protein